MLKWDRCLDYNSKKCEILGSFKFNIKLIEYKERGTINYE